MRPRFLIFIKKEGNVKKIYISGIYNFKQYKENWDLKISQKTYQEKLCQK